MSAFCVLAVLLNAHGVARGPPFGVALPTGPVARSNWLLWPTPQAAASAFTLTYFPLMAKGLGCGPVAIIWWCGVLCLLGTVKIGHNITQ